MRRTAFLCPALACCFAVTCSCVLRAQEPAAPTCAGRIVAAAELERTGVEAWFGVSALDDATFARMQGRSYRDGCPVPRGELRHVRVLHVDFAGAIRTGELVCHRSVADDLAGIFRELYEAGYPIERIELVDRYDGDDERSMAANNTSAFNCRRIAGTTRLSRHALGTAVDINPLYNPCVAVRNGRTVVQPEAGAPYADRSRPFPGRIDRDDLCYKLFRSRGFAWGGDWHSLKDYQHFEKR